MRGGGDCLFVRLRSWRPCNHTSLILCNRTPSWRNREWEFHFQHEHHRPLDRWSPPSSQITSTEPLPSTSFHLWPSVTCRSCHSSKHVAVLVTFISRSLLLPLCTHMCWRGRLSLTWLHTPIPFRSCGWLTSWRCFLHRGGVSLQTIGSACRWNSVRIYADLPCMSISRTSDQFHIFRARD